MVSPVHITSEIAQLRRVLVHRPGVEIAHMTQHELHELLFDDILAPDVAAAEHDLMVDVLAGGGAEVLAVSTMFQTALERSPRAARDELVERACEQAGVDALAAVMRDWPPKQLAHALIGGLRWSDVGGGPKNLARLARELSGDIGMALPPVPNLMFMRDPCMAVGDRVIMGRMATAARAREPLLIAFSLVHSGTLPASNLLFSEPDVHLHATLRRLEGGDVMVLSREVLLIGCSQRTSAETIERLVRRALFEAFPGLARVYAVMMPSQRSLMHLDTILTHIDDKLFLGHAPLVADPAGPRGRRSLRVALLERDKSAKVVPSATVLDVLRQELGADVNMVACGGDDPMQQEREQWTDGANAICVGPGRIILYARNTHTIHALREHGFEEIALHLVQPAAQRKSLIEEGMKRQRAVFSFSGSELSRARGGGRCLTMPLARDAPRGS